MTDATAEARVARRSPAGPGAPAAQSSGRCEPASARALAASCAVSPRRLSCPLT